MTNRLRTIIPVVFQPTDPLVGAGAGGKDSDRVEKLTTFTAITLAVLVVGLLAVLMGTT